MRRRAAAITAIALAAILQTGGHVSLASVSAATGGAAGPNAGPTHDQAVCGAPGAHHRRCHAHVVAAADGSPVAVVPQSTVSSDPATAPRVTNAATTAQPPYTPQDIANAYSLPVASGGTGTTIAVVDAFGDTQAELKLAMYRQRFGLPACMSATGCLRIVDQNGGSQLPAQPRFGSSLFGWVTETDLDLQAASAACPNCSLLLVEAASDADSDLIAGVATAEKSAQAISLSWGGPEDPVTDAQDDKVLSRQGVAIVASAGDSGYGTQFPAASQYVTAVGGTTLNPASTARGWTETVWSGTGSGCSQYETKPSWQTDGGCPRRTVADVAADADPNTGIAVNTTASVTYDPVTGREIAETYGYQQVGGTSLAAPILAGVYALAGNTANVTYGASPYSATSALFDVTSGRNGTCGTYLCTGVVGYDGPTGNGTPNGASAFSGTWQTPLAASAGTMAVAGADSQLHVRHPSGAWIALGGVLTGAPAVVGVPDGAGGVSDVYIVIGTDGALWERSDTAPWRHLSPDYTSCLDSPAATLVGSTLVVVCTGSDHGVWTASTTVGGGGLPSVSGFAGLGGGTDVGPAVAVVGGAVTYFATGTDGHLYQRTSAYGWGGLLGGLCTGHPAAGAAGTMAYAACHGSDGALWYTASAGGGPWGGFVTEHGALVDGPGLAAFPDRVAFTVEGLGGVVYQDVAIVNGASSGWARENGQAVHGAGAAAS